MGRNKKPKYYYEVTISGVGAEGKALAKVNDMVVFTSQAMPGDVVDLQVTRQKKRYEEALITAFRKYSEQRVDPFCSHFGICGGCKWQFMPYPLQLFHKQQQVEDQLKRIGGLKLPPMIPILGSPETSYYRNKLEYTFSNSRWLTPEEIKSGQPVTREDALGFHIPGLYDKILPIEHCWLQPEPSNRIRNFIFNYAKNGQFSFFDIKAQRGFLRTLIIRTSTTGQVMVILSFFHEDEHKRTLLLDALANEFPEITSLMYVINGKGNDTITDQEVICYSGTDHIWEEMEGLRFKISPKSFYQTNPVQAGRLYSIVRDFAGLTGKETVYDLYTGTGTIANFLASRCKTIIGVEFVPEAIEDATINSRVNNISNTRFYAGDIKKVLTDSFISENGKPDVIITDPPRAGMSPEVVALMASLAPRRIVYVSCNPATQARDLALFAGDYAIEKVQPVDMFPHTHHVENVVLLQKK